MENIIDRRMHNGDPRDIAVFIAKLPYRDIANQLNQLKPTTRAEVLMQLPEAPAKGAFLSMDSDAQAFLLEQLDVDQAIRFAKGLPAYTLARIVEVAPESLREQLLAGLPEARRQAIEQALARPVDSVGRIMRDEFLAVVYGTTVEQTLVRLREQSSSPEAVFVHRPDGRLLGTVTTTRLLGAPPATPIEEFIEGQDHRVTASDHKEAAALLIQQFAIPLLPVVDADDRQVGVVRFDDAMDILETETSEDVYKKAGVGDLIHATEVVRSEKLTSGGIGYPVKVRLMFLMVTLAGGLMVGGLIDHFEEVLMAVVALAVFIPLVMDMGGNVGTQSTTIFARGLALGHINLQRFFRRHLLRELAVGLTMGAVLGIVAGLVAWQWQGIPNDIPLLGVVVGFSLFFAVTTASILGFLLPWLMLKIGVDHAPGADPFITTIKDFSGLTVYFLMAVWLLGLTI